MLAFSDVMNFLEENEALDFSLVDGFTGEGIPDDAWVTYKRYELTTDEFELVLTVIPRVPGTSPVLFAIIDGSVAAEFIYEFVYKYKR